MGKAAFRGALLVMLCAFCAPAASAQTGALPRPRSSVLIALDGSSAMRGTKLRAAMAAARAARRAVPAGTPLRVSRYGGRAKAAASCSAAKLARGANVETTVVVVAAGADGCVAPSACQTPAAARTGARVDVIGLELGAADRRALQCTATMADGIYRDARTPAALRPELVAAVLRATRDRRPLGPQLAGGLEQQQATPARPGQYVDSIAPNSERWYSLTVPPGRVLSVAATLVAPPGSDMAAPGSSLELGGSSSSGAFSAITATDLFSFQSDGTATVQTVPPLTPGSYSVRVALHDSADKQLAGKLQGRSLPLELAFSEGPARARTPPRARPAVVAKRKTRDVGFGPAIAAFVACALIAFAIGTRARRLGGGGDQ